MGAWGWYYRQGFKADGDELKAEGIRAIKVELIYNGYDGGGIIVDLATFGSNAASAAKSFQHAHGLAVDGVVGPNTARVLFRKRIGKTEQNLGIPEHLLAKLLHLESQDDPVAVGTVDASDHGIAQIHLPAHPDVSEAQANDPTFAIPWAGNYLHGLFTATGSVDYDLALAAYNLGTSLAIKWGDAGKPTSGGPKLDDGRDAYTVASQYVSLVHASSF